MSNQLTAAMLAQIFAQESSDPYLMLMTISHPSFATIRLVNNSEDIVSRGNTFMSFPMNIRLPMDDGDSTREVVVEFDNVSLELMDEIRSVTSPMDVKIEMILASDPDTVQTSLEELKMRSAVYTKQRISAKLYLDSFLNIELPSEKYGPKNFPGLF